MLWGVTALHCAKLWLSNGGEAHGHMAMQARIHIGPHDPTVRNVIHFAGLCRDLAKFPIRIGETDDSALIY